MTANAPMLRIALCLMLLSGALLAWGQFATWNISDRDKVSYSRDGGNYTPAPELKERLGVPRGTIKRYRLNDSAVYPDVPHDYWLYVPAQHGGQRSSCLMVILDGEVHLRMGLTNLMDNLIHQGQIPVMIGVFINAGPNGPGYPLYGGSDNRSIEYDSVNGEYAKFLIEDVLPRVSELYNISEDSGCRGIMGRSSGGAAAFGVAWHRPDIFTKVISVVGSFVNIRGADAYPSLIRRAERKPLRVFLQSGANDLDTVFGNWPLANQQMAAALAYREYDYRFEFGEGGHNGRHFASVAADVMRWLWRDALAPPFVEVVK